MESLPEIKEEPISEADEASLRKIQEQLAAMRFDGGLLLSLGSHLSPLPKDIKLKREGGKMIADLPRAELMTMLRRLQEKYRQNLEDLFDEEKDESIRHAKLLDNFGYFRRFGVGNKEELLEKLLEFGDREREREGSRFYGNAGELMHFFIEYRYFPKDPRFRNIVRDHIKSLLGRGKTEKRREENRRFVLDHIERFIKEGVLDEKNDEDIIGMATE